MKTKTALIVVLSWTGVIACGAELSADATAVESRITEVTVFADRAQVTREGKATLNAGPGRFSFAKLPGWLDEGSVRVALRPADAGKILDVQVERTYLTRPSDEEFRKAEAAVRDIGDQVRELDDEKAVFEAQAKQVEAIRMFSMEKLPKDAAVREIKPAEYGETVKFIAASLREIAQGKREIEKKRRELEPEQQVRQRKLEDLRQRAQLEQLTVVVTVEGAGARAADLALTYMTPGGNWEPVHELRANGAGGRINLASYAVVTQTTGEDWTGVKLSVSTQRSTDTLKIPELEALLLGTGQRLGRVIASKADSFATANKNYLAQNTIFFDINNGDVMFQQEYRRNRELQMDNIKRIGRVFETLQERGTTAHFPALGGQTIRGDGRPVRVPIGTVELASQPRIIAAPAVSLNAARTVDLTNTSSQAILPGKVALFATGGFLGQTETDFVAPGEGFAMYMGVADQVKLSRLLDKKHSELKRAGQRTRMQVVFVLTVENLADRPVALQLTDRVPVSESGEIKVSGVKVQPDAKPDSKGILKWDVNLAAKENRTFRLEYTLDYPSDLAERQARQQQEGATPMDAEALPAQILQLERKF